ncbi:MAG: DNA polymerase IV, partial [Calditrichia bacterium]|nr:DNA polymerase IV [Calditrichia bacterium]
KRVTRTEYRVTSMRTIMHIDADAFFASVEQGFNPQLRNRPVIVGGTENQRGVVHTASYEARSRGVRTGMALVHAKQICPNAVFLKGHYEHYQAISLLLQETYTKYTPIVEFTSLDDAYLDLTGTLHLHPSPEQIARDIQVEVWEKTGVGLSMGIGINKAIANIASDLEKPKGIVNVPAGKEKEFLSPLPVDALPGVGRMAKEKLTDLGIFTVGQLALFSKLLLEQLFGKNGKKLWDLANGNDPREVKQRNIPRQISRETSFEEDTADMAIIKGTLQYLTERLAKKLRQNELVGQTVQVKIRYSDFGNNNRSRSLPYPSNDSGTLFKLAETLFDEIRLRRVRIRHVGVAVTQISPLNWQASLFNSKNRQESLNTTIDQIREKFGFMAIIPAETIELKRKYRMEPSGYVLHNPALTR